MRFSQFLEMKFLEWQQQSGGRKTVKEFAEWLGFKQSTVSTWWSDKYPPNAESAEKLAFRLGPEVYDLLGLERPDPRLVYIQRVWGHSLVTLQTIYTIPRKKRGKKPRK